jgi:type IV secretion system protein VirB9
MKQFLKFSLISLFAFCLTASAFAQVPVTTDSRIRTLVYNPNEVYEVKFFYNYQSFIEFSPDEEIEMISIGEAFAWRLTPAGKRLFIRPLEVAARTNMTVITNKRTYHFDIRSGEYDGKADEELVYTIRFFYPQVDQPLPILPQLTVPNIAAKKQPTPIPVALPPSGAPAGFAPMQKPGVIKTPMPKPKASEKIPGILQRNPEGVELNFDYSLAGKSDNIAPLKVYDDGRETFFQFANDNLVVPSINLVDANGTEQTLPYIIRDNYVAVPAVNRQFTLRLSEGLICIYNNKMLALKKRP